MTKSDWQTKHQITDEEMYFLTFLVEERKCKITKVRTEHLAMKYPVMVNIKE